MEEELLEVADNALWIGECLEVLRKRVFAGLDDRPDILVLELLGVLVAIARAEDPLAPERLEDRERWSVKIAGVGIDDLDPLYAPVPDLLELDVAKLLAGEEPDLAILIVDVLIGIEEDILFKNREKTVRIPMIGDTRSLNLSNSVAIAVYEVLRQKRFPSFKMNGNLRKYSWEDAR